MHIVFISNQAKSMSKFWTCLLTALVSKGHSISCYLPYSEEKDAPYWENELTQIGVKVKYYPLERKGLNPFKDLITCYQLYKALRKEKAELLFCSTIKPVIYGAFAAKLAGKPVQKNRYLMITGLGYSFEANSPAKRFLEKIVSKLYYYAFKCVSGVFFQNKDDQNLFVGKKIIPATCNVFLCKGTGVDTDLFYYSAKQPEKTHFIFIGRLLEAKGLCELAEASRRLRKQGYDFDLQVLGPLEKGVGSIPLSAIQAWEKEHLLRYLGEAKDVRPYLSQSDVLVLPSWREGLPCTIMEAMSMGKAVIAADAPGSRDLVQHAVNGLLVPVKSPELLAKSLETYILSPHLAYSMGQKGREMAVQELDAHKVAESICKNMGL